MFRYYLPWMRPVIASLSATETFFAQNTVSTVSGDKVRDAGCQYYASIVRKKVLVSSPQIRLMKIPPRTKQGTAHTSPVEPGRSAQPRREKAAIVARRSRFIVQSAVVLLALIGMAGTIAALCLSRAGSSPLILSLLFAGQVLLSGACVVLIYRNISRARRLREKQESLLQEANATLQEQADTDGLTSLKNRRAFERHLQEEMLRAKRYGYGLSLLLIDVDHFKRFNDTWGHLAGDETLRQTASLLQAQSRTSDFVSRYGGEEFALLLPHTGETAALLTADRIRTAFRRHPWPHQAVTVSIGVATLTAEVVAPTDLIHQSDTALYWAKQQGRDRTVVASAT